MCCLCSLVYRHRCHGDGDILGCSAGRTDTPKSSRDQKPTVDTLLERRRCRRTMELRRYCQVFTSCIYCLWLLVILRVSLSDPDFIVWVYWQRWLGTVEGLTEVAKASIESGVTQTGSVGPVAAAIIGAVALFMT